VESVHLSTNSVNKCPFCTGLHTEIGRLAGLEDAIAVNECGKVADAEKDEFGIFSEYGAAFGENHGRGEEVESLFEKIKAEKGQMAASSAKGLALFLLWGSLGGNTLLAFFRGTLRGNVRPGTNVYFEGAFAVYHIVVFAIITATSKILSFLPSNVPKVVNIIIGLVLPTVASIWIIPYGLLGLIITPIIGTELYYPIGGEYTSVGRVTRFLGIN